MGQEHAQIVARQFANAVGVLGGLFVLVVTTGCGDSGSIHNDSPSPSTLRIGIGSLPQQAPQAGLRQVVATLSLESLITPNDDGHVRPTLAESVTTTPDGLSVAIHLRPTATFHDGSPVTASVIAQSLEKSLPALMGAAWEDVNRISVAGPTELKIELRQRSRFVIEALDTGIQKPDKIGIGTGPYASSAATSPAELHRYSQYYRGPAVIDRITITPYPSVRTAWAELLRGNLDMLYDVNIDELDSLQASSAVAVFSYVRHYQNMIVFSSRATNLQSAEVRRELNAAIDRNKLVHDALNGLGVPSTGPLPPQHWALEKNAPKFEFNAALARNLASRHLHFTCLVPADSAYERIALAVKQQLAAASVDMRVEEVSQEQILQATRNNNYEAVLLDPTSGPTAFRSYRLFSSKISFTPKPRVSPLIDGALDQIRHASSDDAYRSGVTAFQRAIVDDPPALFLAWGERARAVSRQFVVTAPETGGDILKSLWLWRPSGAQRAAHTN